MNISKTIFKEYTRCPKVYVMDQVHKQKMNAKISIFDTDKFDKVRDLLSTMFDSDTGDDLINVTNPQLEALLPYYNKLEEEAMKIAMKKFKTDIIYSLDTKKQKSFSFTDEYGHNFYCYLDGYKELENDILVFEVKATTSKKFIELGYTEKKEKIPLFIDIDDVLIPNPEVKKANCFSKLYNRYSDVGKYVFDIAIERYIISNSIKQKYPEIAHKKIKYFLIVLNAKYVFDGTYTDNQCQYNRDELGNELVTFIDLTEVTASYYKDMDIERKRINTYIQESNLEKPRLGAFCERKKQTKCVFCRVCYRDALKKGSILEYFGNHHGFKDGQDVRHEIYELLNGGQIRMDSIPKSWLANKNQIIQRECYENNTIYWDYNKLKKALKLLKYPIYHLDFESFPCPLPRYKGERPYMQSLFQFSIHVEKEMGKCDKITDHVGFLAASLKDHREELVKSMLEVIDLSNGGTVLVYNKNFEYSRINELANFFPEYTRELLKINEHMFDLLDLLKARSTFYIDLGYSEEESKINNFYHNNLAGSYSIKKVLPVFSDLTYNGMAVANGTDAIAAYATFNKLSGDDLEAVKMNLTEYCRQDTWAMVVILNEIIRRANE